MATLLTNQFMANINWTGQGNKVAFGKLLLLKVISSEQVKCIIKYVSLFDT